MWHDIYLEEKFIGELIEKGSGHFKKEYYYILVPGEKYTGYTFLLSAKCVSKSFTEKGQYLISLEDDMKLELFMHPDHRESSTRYKRYKLSGQELISEVLEDYETALMYESIEKQQKLDRRNKRITGSIVYGKYMGNHYGDKEDLFSEFYFCHDGVYYNRYHSKVRNVDVAFTLYENVSKYFFYETERLIQTKMIDYVVLTDYIESLREMERSFTNMSMPDNVSRVTEIIESLEIRKREMAIQTYEELRLFLEEKQ